MRFLAVYEGDRFASTELLAVSSDPDLIGYVSEVLYVIDGPKKKQPLLSLVTVSPVTDKNIPPDYDKPCHRGAR